jgi:hypothetical protein
LVSKNTLLVTEHDLKLDGRNWGSFTPPTKIEECANLLSYFCFARPPLPVDATEQWIIGVMPKSKHHNIRDVLLFRFQQNVLMFILVPFVAFLVFLNGFYVFLMCF